MAIRPFGIPPSPSVSIEQGSGRPVSPSWYTFFNELFRSVGSGQAPISLAQQISDFMAQTLSLAVPTWLTVTGSPVGGPTGINGTLTIAGTSEARNLVLASPSGASGALSPRSLVGSDLPNPTASTLGGVESFALVTHEFLTSISTAGVPAAAQPTFTDISGTVAAAQLPPVTESVVHNTFDLTTATGAVQNISLTFTPSSVDGFGAISAGAVGAYTTYNAHSDSAGNQGCLFADATTAIGISNAVFFSAQDATAANGQTAVISYSANTVTLTWTKTGTPTGTFTYSLRCFR